MSRFRLPRLGRGIGRAQALSAAGVFAAAVLAVNVNWLSARTYVRWDFTSEGLYTLSQPTRELLRALDEPVDVVVLLSRADPLAVSVRHLLAAYRAETSALRVTSIDPDQQPAQFLAIQQKYGILSGKTEDGRIVTDASIVVARGDRHWFLTPDDLLRFDEEAGRVQPALEQALTEGIANVLGTEKATICFSRGHDELGLNDAGPEGLAELRNRIEKNNYAVEERDLRTDPGTALAGCRLLVVAGPKLRFGEAASASIVRAVRDGMSALVLASPTVDDDGRFSPSGLEPVAALAGAELANDLVLETDPGRRLPRGLGEVFFAEPVAHPVTRGLAHGGRPELDVLVSESRSIVPKQGAGVVLRTSDAAVSLGDVRPILEGRLGDVVRAAEPRRFVLAVGSELAKPREGAPAPRLLLVGTASVAENRVFRDPALYGSRMFVENAISWLSARPALVSVPEKPSRAIGLGLTEEALSEVMRYVLIYMPGSAAVIGLFVLLRRRAVEARSRRAAHPREDEDAARS